MKNTKGKNLVFDFYWRGYNYLPSHPTTYWFLGASAVGVARSGSVDTLHRGCLDFMLGEGRFGWVGATDVPCIWLTRVTFCYD
jgi:hypothetical protein